MQVVAETNRCNLERIFIEKNKTTEKSSLPIKYLCLIFLRTYPSDSGTMIMCVHFDAIVSQDMKSEE